MTAGTSGPLAEIKVLEAAQVVAGPVCGMLLADLGAEIIKVERIVGGDDLRRFVPPDIDGESTAYMMVNRNKRGIALDLKTDGGKEAFARLARGTDILIENFRKGVMERFGIGYETLKQDNPGLIYCAISGFGRTGPYAERGGYDLVAQAMSGLMSITGEAPGRQPVKVGSPVTDYNAGLLAAFGILAALQHRHNTGQGQMVDTSLFEAGIAATFHQSSMFLATGVNPGPMGSAHPLSAPYQAFETKDGWITVGAGNQANWQRLAKALGVAELAEDARFKMPPDRMANLDALVAALTPPFKSETTQHWMDAMEQAGVPAGPVNSIGAMLSDPQAIARDMVPEVDHPRLGKVKTLGTPVKLSGSPTTIRRAAPVHGQHTAEVLAELGFSEVEIADMERDGAALIAKV